jgi:hypothetical protein
VTLLDRHLFKGVLATCLAAVALFAFIVALPNVVRELLSPLLAGQFGPATFVRLVGLLLPFAISFALPMGMLTGILLTLGRLSADHEITAMRAAGLSLARIARPVLVLAALGTALAIHINLESAPWARAEFHRLPGPADGVEFGGITSSMGEYTPRFAVGFAARIDGDHDALGPEAVRGGCDQLRVFNGRGVERDLVCAGLEHALDVFDGAQSAAHGEGHEALGRSAGNNVMHDAAAVAGRRDVQEDQFVGTLGVVGLC